MMRRLEQGDEQLLREAWEWTANAPAWFQDADRVFSQGSVDDFVAQLSDRGKWFIGVFNPTLEAMVIVERREAGQFEGHLMVHRGNVNVLLIQAAITQLLYDLLDCGLSEASCWVAEKNLGVRKLCAKIGFHADGLVMYRGSYKGRLIRWLRYSIQREELTLANVA